MTKANHLSLQIFIYILIRSIYWPCLPPIKISLVSGADTCIVILSYYHLLKCSIAMNRLDSQILVLHGSILELQM